MKNIQVIDGAANCTFSIFQATDEEFALLSRTSDKTFNMPSTFRSC